MSATLTTTEGATMAKEATLEVSLNDVEPVMSVVNAACQVVDTAIHQGETIDDLIEQLSKQSPLFGLVCVRTADLLALAKAVNGLAGATEADQK